MNKHIVYIALGSNIGDRINYLRQAIEKLNNNENISVEEASSVYETLPYGNKDQANFYNAVIRISTGYELIELLDCLKEIEKNLGRLKKEKWGPREIDLDLLFYNHLIYSDERITVPHKEIIKRDFVLVPLCEIAPQFIHPELNKKICDICIQESEKNIIRKIPDKIL